jgi:hypothetical protein
MEMASKYLATSHIFVVRSNERTMRMSVPVPVIRRDAQLRCLILATLWRTHTSFKQFCYFYKPNYSHDQFEAGTGDGQIRGWYCDMSTHCWVAQLVSRHRPVNKNFAQTRWRHATVLEYRSTQHAAMTSHGTRSRAISRDMFPASATITQHKASCVVPLYDWGFYKRNWNI